MSPKPTEELPRLEKAVSKLPRKQRQIFLAHRVEGLSYGEIADRTGLTHRQVERQMARAMCKLSKQMEGCSLRFWERWF